jgi:hypothetical protein
MNFYFSDYGKKIVVDDNSKTISLTINGNTKSFKFDDIKKVYYFKGRKGESRVYAMPFSFYHYYKFCTQTEVFTISNLSCDFLPNCFKIEEKIRFLNFVNKKNNWIQEKNGELEIKKHDREELLRFRSMYENSSNAELEKIRNDINGHRIEVREAVGEILEERNANSR